MIKPETPDNEIQRLQALKDYHILDTLPEQAYDDMATIAAQICGVPIALISLIDQNRQWIKAGHGIPSVIRELPREYSCCAHTILAPDAFMEVPDTSQDERFADNPLAVSDPHIQFYAGAALTNKDGLPIGTLCVIDHSPNKLTDQQVKSLKALSRQIMALLELRKETLEFDQNKSRLQQLVESISDVVYDLDELGNFTYVNPALIELSGYGEEELLGKAYFDLVHPDFMDELGKFYYEQIKARQDSSYFEFPIVSKSGEVVWLGQTVKIFFEGERVARVGAVAKNVTELKRVTKELESSESLYRLLSDNSANLVCLQTPDGRFTFVSQALKDITGMTQEEFMQVNPAKLCHPDDRDRVIALFQEVLKGKELTSSYRFMNKSGDYVWLESIAKPVYSETGQIMHVQTSSRDISERKQNEERIKREEANLKALIENSTDIIWSIDYNYRYITFNSHFQQSVKTQINVDLEIGQSILFHYFPEKAKQYWQALYDRAFRGERFIEEMRAINDKNTFFECSFNPIIGDLDKVIGVSVFARDISERVKVEMKRKRFQEGLSMLNELSSNFDIDYNDLIERAIKEVCIFYDMEQGMLGKVEGDDYFIKYAIDAEGNRFLEKGTKLVLSDTFCKITHDSNGIVTIDKASDTEFKSHPGYRLLQMESYLGSPVSIGKEPFGTLSLSSRSPRTVAFDNYDKEFFEVFARWVGAILERRNYERLLLESKEKAENASQAKANFLSTMSHEIRTPLNAIIGMTHILLQDNPKSSQLENLNILKFSGENLLVLVNDVLDINKIESGKLLLEQSDFNLKELLEGIRNSLIYSIEEKGLESRIEYDPALPETMTGDSMRIAQILNNLISNAIKFTRKGGINILAQSRGIADGIATIYLEVRDSGIGITPKELSLVFERFTQAKSSTTREFGGSGLGLSIVKGLLQLMDSDIQVESSPESGSRFFFELRLPVADKRPVADTSHRTNLDRLSMKNTRILLVEDNKVNQLVAEKFLLKWGVSVSMAENGLEAVEFVKKESFDLILMDLQMPVMDGYEATKQIRDMGCETPIMALTASVRIGQKNRAMKVGMNDFLVKPLTPADLYSKIARFIDTEHFAETEERYDLEDNNVQEEFQALREMLQGDDDFKAEVVPLYIKNIQAINNLLPEMITNGDAKAADKLRHKMLTTLHTLETTTIRNLIDDGIALINKDMDKAAIESFKSELKAACADMEQQLVYFMG